MNNQQCVHCESSIAEYYDYEYDKYFCGGLCQLEYYDLNGKHLKFKTNDKADFSINCSNRITNTPGSITLNLEVKNWMEKKIVFEKKETLMAFTNYNISELEKYIILSRSRESYIFDGTITSSDKIMHVEIEENGIFSNYKNVKRSKDNRYLMFNIPQTVKDGKNPRIKLVYKYITIPKHGDKKIVSFNIPFLFKKFLIITQNEKPDYSLRTTRPLFQGTIINCTVSILDKISGTSENIISDYHSTEKRAYINYKFNLLKDRDSYLFQSINSPNTIRFEEQYDKEEKPRILTNNLKSEDGLYIEYMIPKPDENGKYPTVTLIQDYVDAKDQSFNYSFRFPVVIT